MLCAHIVQYSITEHLVSACPWHLFVNSTFPSCLPCCMYSCLPSFPPSCLPSCLPVQLAVVRRGTYAMFDYGPLRNLLRYGSLHPPAYDPSLMPRSVPLAFALGGMDALSTPQDIAILTAKLPVPPELFLFPRYSHLDFVYGATTQADLYPNVLQFLVQHLN